jgi:GTP-binding protein HflX
LNTEKAILIGVATRETPRPEVELHLDELERLVETAGAATVHRELRVKNTIDAATFLGSGAVEEIAALAEELGATMIVFDDDLTPGQVKNLEKTLPRVVDRTGLILEIFSRHARSREARTQVELARLEYLLPRLTGRYEGLSRQMGGAGGRGGAGEQQLELDRRRIRRRIAGLKRDLEKIENSRSVQKRRRRDFFQVAIAGYTNAGKTTLFNALSRHDEYAADRLFATLDARVAKISGTRVLVVDTVGLIRKLPPGLIASFRSTLGEIRDADLVLHAIDASSPTRDEERRVAEATFAELRVLPEKILPVYTKADLAPGPAGAITVSAVTGDGLPALLSEIDRCSTPDAREIAVRIPYTQSREIARARARTRVLSERDDGDALVLVLSGASGQLSKLSPFEISR